MKKILLVSNLVIFLMSISLVSACKNAVLYNQYGVPISSYGGIVSITYSDYPLDAVMIDYTLSVKNNNNQGLTVNFNPSSALSNGVFPANITLGPNEQKNVTLQVNVGGNDNSGELYVEGQCDDATPMSEGVLYVSIKGRGSVVPCTGTSQNCGMPGMCEDVTQYNGCYDGYYRNYYCGGNTKQFKIMCTSACCRLVGGTCQNNICSVPHFSITLPMNITNETGKPKTAIIKLYQPGTTIVVNSSTITGYNTISSPNVSVDLGLEYDSSVLNILFRNLNLTQMSGTLKFTLDDVSTTIQNATLIKAYKISTSLSSFDGTLKFKYSGLPFINEQGLAIYKCSSFNNTSNMCNGNWVKQSTTKDTVNDVASTDITSFSVYALGESQITTTTTTTTSTTTTTTSGSSNNDNSYSGSSYSGGGIYTTTTIGTTTTLAECTCDSWSNSACGESPCDQTQMKQQRTCTPSGCNIETQCVVDNSCNIQQVNETENKTTMDKPTGLFVLPNFSQYFYPFTGIIILVASGLAIWKFNDRIRGVLPPHRPYYKMLSSKSSRKGNVTVDIKTPKYLEVKMVEKPKEITKPIEKPKVSIEARNKSINEMRNRALEMDKKIKRK